MSERREMLVRRAPWLVLPAVAVLAFSFGTCARGETRPGTDGEDDGALVDHGRWTCAMHPQIQRAEPGACPICGMDLVPIREEEGDQASGGSAVPQRTTLSERARTLAKIRTTRVVRAGRGAGRAEHRLLGRVTADESTLKDVTTWISGRIDRLHVDVTGVRVRRGQVIATLFSPEVYAAHQDLLVAKRSVERLGAGTDTARRATAAALESSRQRLRLLGVPDAELARMEIASAPTRSVAIHSPFAGTVVERGVTEGSYVQTGAVLCRLADLTRLWVQLDAYESDLASLSVGQAVSLTVQALPGVTIDGRVAFVDPVIDPMRRTARVRVEVDASDGQLRPGMFAEAVLGAPNMEGSSTSAAATLPPLVIPATAPLFTGRRSLVYVEVADTDRPTYEPRTVRLGPRTGDRYPVLEGLMEGERVVIEGAFVVDAELELRGGPSMMNLPSEDAPAAAMVEMSASLRAALAALWRAYLAMSDALAEDNLDAATARASEVAIALARVDTVANARDAPEPSRAWALVAPRLRMDSARATTAADIPVARDAYRSLSTSMQELLRVFGNPLDEAIRVAHCPMADDYRGADWLQRAATVQNPYFGAEMPACGNIEATVVPGSRLDGARERDGSAPGR